MTQAAARPGETVLVTGIGGGVATFALKWAVALGARTFVTSGNPAKLEQAQQLGAVGGVDYRAEGWVKRLVELSGGPDVIVDGTGGASFQHYFLALKPAGRLVVYGSTAGNPPIGLDLVRLFFRQTRRFAYFSGRHGSSVRPWARLTSLPRCCALSPNIGSNR